MSRLPFPISDNWSDARPQIEELLRVLFEERIGGLKVSSSLEANNDTLRLFLGDANTHLMMNADGDGVKYATPYKIGSISRAMNADSGDVSYTGVGGKPSHVIFIGSSADGGLSVGMDDGTTKGVLYWYAASTTFASSSAVSVALVDKDGGSQSAVIKSKDSDGFTLTWTKDSSPGTQTATVFYMAFL